MGAALVTVLLVSFQTPPGEMGPAEERWVSASSTKINRT